MSKNLEHKGYTAKIEYSYEDEVFFGTINGIVDLVTFEGTSVEELKKAFVEAVDDYLDICSRYGKEPDKEYKGTFNIRISPELHKKAAIEAGKKRISLNQIVEISISKYLSNDYINKTQNISIYYTPNTCYAEKQSVVDLWTPSDLQRSLVVSRKGVCQ